MDDRQTRIVATLGPSTAAPRPLQRLLRAGVDVVRLNFSYGTPEEHVLWGRRVRAAASRMGRPVGLMVDLQGMKPRLGRFDGTVTLKRGQQISLVPRQRDADPQAHILPVDYRGLLDEARPGQSILLADGRIELRTVSVKRGRVQARVLVGGEVTARAGLALPEAEPERTALTAEDRRGIVRASEMGADFLAVSFVRRADDLASARKLLRRQGSQAMVIAKIETAAAVRQLDAIVAEADGLMVARGDLGVEMPQEDVPLVQKKIIAAANAAGKPVITATEMLESMRTSRRPTRAEATDVANAVLDGSWALMLSAETAVGRYPGDAVRTMARIARRAERHRARGKRLRKPDSGLSVSEGVASAAVWIAFDVGAQAIVALTRSGATARQIARFAPTVPVFGYTPRDASLTRMTLFRGITPRRLAEQKSLEKLIEQVSTDLLRHRDARKGDIVVFIGGDPRRSPGETNRLVVHEML